MNWKAIEKVKSLNPNYQTDSFDKDTKELGTLAYKGIDYNYKNIITELLDKYGFEPVTDYENFEYSMFCIEGKGNYLRIYIIDFNLNKIFTYIRQFDPSHINETLLKIKTTIRKKKLNKLL